MNREQDEYFEKQAATGCRCGDMPGRCPGRAHCPMESDDAFGDVPRLPDLSPYASLQEAADDLLSEEQLAESFDKIEAAVLALKENGDW